MDPNAALAAARDFASVAKRTRDKTTKIDQLEAALEYFENLDEWLSKGGFLPTAWQR